MRKQAIVARLATQFRKKKFSLDERTSKRLLEETKQRLRLQQEARTIARIEELEIEACERLERQLQLEHKELNGELECSETDTAKQYTLYWSDSEEDLTKEQSSSTTDKSELETPD